VITLEQQKDWKLKEVFWTPYEQHKEHNGKRFEIIGEVTEGIDEEIKGELFNIRLEDGTEIQAWFEEIYIVPIE